MGGESTDSSQSVSKPLTAAERQDLYRSSIGNILNTYTQSGLPYGGMGSMNGGASNAVFSADGSAKTVTSPVSSGGQLYDARGNSSVYDQGGDVTLDPKTYFQTNDPTVNMPTGAPDPGGINFPVYQTPTYQQPGSYTRMNGGNYQALQDALTAGYTAPLDAAKLTDMRDVNSDAAKRGIWSSGLVGQKEADISGKYAPQYAAAGAQATGARYGMEQQDNQGQNAFNQSAAGAANAFNITNANNAFQAGLTPLEYLRNLWSGTSGQTSGSSSFGQKLEVGI